MTQHVLARLAGHGRVLLPLAPFRFDRVPGRPLAVSATHSSESGTRSAVVDLASDPPGVALGEGTAELSRVLDLLPGPDIDSWRIETSVHVCPWPEGFALVSPPAGDPVPFYLVGPGDAAVFVQGPFPATRVPPPGGMAAPGQTLLRQGLDGRGPWAELGYDHEGEQWRQWHRVVAWGGDHVLVVTSQSPLVHADAASVAAAEVAEGLEPYSGEA